MVILTTSNFIRMITTVIFTIASVLFPNALEVLAREFVRATRFVFRVTFFPFISSITTIVIMIAQPTLIRMKNIILNAKQISKLYLVDATSIGTSELIFTARFRCCAMVQSGILIRTVNTIWITITQPFSWYTLRSPPRFISFTSKFCLFITFTII